MNAPPFATRFARRRPPTAEEIEETGLESNDGVHPEHNFFDAIIAAVISDGFDVELNDCLNEEPMQLRYRAASVTDVLWLDHESLVYLKNVFPRSAAVLRRQAVEQDMLLKVALQSDVRNLTEGLFIHSKVVRNGEVSRENVFMGYGHRSPRLTLISLVVVEILCGNQERRLEVSQAYAWKERQEDRVG